MVLVWGFAHSFHIYPNPFGACIIEVIDSNEPTPELKPALLPASREAHYIPSQS
jgi:hypothetical protein